MEQTKLSPQALEVVSGMQRNETDEHVIYTRIAGFAKGEDNRRVLRQIGADEQAHAKIWQQYTGRALKPRGLRCFWYTLLARVFGFTFAVKLMESGEENACGIYGDLAREVPEATQISEDESRHENELLAMLDEERLQYVGSMVLGLNDALVELTGTLAGLTFALQNTRLIALSGLITGISATLSMASSEYLSSSSEGRSDALKSCTYTGIAYCITVALLVLPYLLFPPQGYLWAMVTMLLTTVLIIACFNYYIAVAKGLSFRKRFGEMAAISLSVAAVSFVIGLLVKRFLGIDV
mgnify:CR=1 FL=1